MTGPPHWALCLAVAAAIVPAAQDGAAAVDPLDAQLTPPFAVGPPFQTSSILLPCEEVLRHPSPYGSDPSSGLADVGTAVEAQDCVSLGYDRTEVWKLGSAPADLVGRPAAITVVVDTASVVSEGEGAARIGGRVSLTVGGSSPVTLGWIECRAGICNRLGVAVGPSVLHTAVEALPGEIEAQFRAEASVQDGTGRASVRYTGRLLSVIVSPAEVEAPAGPPA